MLKFSLGKVKIAYWALAALLSVGIFVPHLMAQADKGILSGTVTDTSGAVVVGANIQVTDVGTGVSYSAVTDSQGSWVIPELLVGNYQVQATKAGFQKMVHSGITLTVGAHLLVDFKLPVGQATEVVTVTGEVSQVDSTTATVSSLVAPKQMADLPLNGRNFEQLLSLAAGVQFVSQQRGRRRGVERLLRIGEQLLGLRIQTRGTVVPARQHRYHQLLAAWHRLLGHRQLAGHGRHPGIQCPDQHLQRRVWRHGSSRQCRHQVGHERPAWVSLRVSPQQRS